MSKTQVSVDAAFRGSIASARLLEDEIERRGLWREYTSALVEELDIYGDKTYYDWDREWVGATWLLLRATPEQRARAYLKVISDAS